MHHLRLQTILCKCEEPSISDGEHIRVKIDLRKLDAKIGGLRISAAAGEDLEGVGAEEGALRTKHSRQRNVTERLLLNAK